MTEVTHDINDLVESLVKSQADGGFTDYELLAKGYRTKTMGGQVYYAEGPYAGKKVGSVRGQGQAKAPEGKAPQSKKDDAVSNPSRPQHGFDNSFIGVDNFKKILSGIGASTEGELRKVSPHSEMKAFVWKGKDVTIVTGNNPLTGEYRGEGRSPEKGYASYIGIQGSEDGVADAVEFLKTYNQGLGEESAGTREFI